jgi:hypothetical protein
LTPVTTFANYVPYGPTPAAWGVPVPSAIEEIQRTGFIGTYYGCKIIAIDQIWDNIDDYNPLFDTTKVLVIGDNVGEFITYGDVKRKQWTDWEPTPPVFKIELYTQYGMMIWNAQGIYVIDGLS